ncbi:MAG: OmpH family outer membrane protein [Saprospiraceae bacterium]|nr:OmpH family outer membrane protein [Saprospiraceae bacterium]
MKNISLVLNIILLLAVAYLFIDKFSGKDEVTNELNNEKQELAGAIPTIVYLNADSLLEQYEYFKAKQDELAEREKSADASLKARGRALEKEMMTLAQKAQSGTMTRKEMEEADIMLRQKQESLMRDQDEIAKDLLASGNTINDQLQSTLRNTLDSLKNARGYTFVMSYGSGSPVLAATDSLDITRDVVEILNKINPVEKK